MQTHANRVLLALLFSLAAAAIAVARPHPINALTPSEAHSDRLSYPTILPDPPIKRNFALRIKNLPYGYTGTFITFVSICPQAFVTATFIRFFRLAADLSATDPSPGRRHQRFTYGVLALELAVEGKDEVVSREFVQATSLWLLDAAVKGWTGFFRAWVTDGFDAQVVEVRMGTIFDMPADDGLEIEV